VSEEEKQPVPISVVALRAESYAADRNAVVISLRTKYSTAERKYSVPVECFHDLIVDLHRLNAVTSGEQPATSDQGEPLLPLPMPEAAE
jgi:hypothetical protein